MTQHWTDRLSEYLDGDMPAEEAGRLERHVASCAGCAATLAELREVVAAAATLPDTPPARDLWPDIAARLTPRGPSGVGTRVVPLQAGRPAGRRRVSFTVSQLLAAGIALILFSAGGAWLTVRAGDTPAAGAPVASAPAGSVTLASSWETAVADLEAEFDRRRPDLDPATIMVVERNLAIINDAIAEAERALEADPASGFLNGYVAEAMRRKVDLLRQATRIQRTES